MTIKITELPSISSSDLNSSPSTVLPVVSNYDGDFTTYKATIDDVKSYMEAGDFNPGGNVNVGGDLNVNGNLNITGANNLAVTDNVIELHVANTANIAEPWTYNDGKDIGIRFHWFNTADQSAALVFSHDERALEWYDTGALGANTFTGTSYGTTKMGAAKFVNTTPTTGNATGSLQTYGGMSATGNIWAGGWVKSNTNVIAVGDITGATANISGIAQVGSLRSNATASISTTLTTGGTATLNALSVNTTTSFGGNITSNLVVQAGIQNTPIGNATASSGKFTTLNATSSTTLDGTVSIDGTLTTNGIVPFGSANANIGSVANPYSYVHAVATSALYADLAERYVADQSYDPGTVVVFGGEQEITVTSVPGDTRVAGAISTDPAYLMNAGSEGLPVALRGKVPVKITGPVTKGDLLVTSSTEGYAKSARSMEHVDPNAVFAKSLETNAETGLRTIWAVIV